MSRNDVMVPLPLEAVLGIRDERLPGLRGAAGSPRADAGDVSGTTGRGSPTVSPDIPRGPMGTTGPFARRTVPGGGAATPVPRTDLDVALGANASEMPRRFGLQLWDESAACCRVVSRFPPCSPSPDHVEAGARAWGGTPP